ncbi:MAG: hypothetical protein ACF8PN_00805 [Phycisphaerales bacterium]
MIHDRLSRGLAILAAGAGMTLAATAQADVIYETEDPFGGWFGIMGFDVFQDQSVAVRFTPAGDYTLDQVSAWFWHNGPSGTRYPDVTLTLRLDDTNGQGESRPSSTILETWVIDVSSAAVFDPQLFTVSSSVNPTLESGAHYWLVAEAVDAPGGDDPVWAWAQPGNGFMSFGRGGAWDPGHSGAVVSVIVEGTPDVHAYQLDVSEPVVAGTNTTFTVSGGLPDARTWLAYSLHGPGSTPVPALGVTLDLANPAQAGDPVTTDSTGGVRWDLFTPTAAQGRTVWVQSAQRGAKSNVVSRRVQ